MASWWSFHPPLKIGLIVTRLHSLGAWHFLREILNTVVTGPASFSGRYEIPSGPDEFLLGQWKKNFPHTCCRYFFKFKGSCAISGSKQKVVKCCGHILVNERILEKCCLFLTIIIYNTWPTPKPRNGIWWVFFHSIYTSDLTPPLQRRAVRIC